MNGSEIEKIRKTLLGGFYLVAVMLVLRKVGSCYGYRIKKFLHEQGGKVFNPSESTIYTLLHNLEKKGMVKSYWALTEGNVPRKFYELTDDGKKFLADALKLIDSIYDFINKIRR